MGRTKPWWHSGVYAAKNSSKQPEKGKKTMERAEAGMERNGSPSSLMTAVDRFDRGVLLCPEDTYQLVYSIGSLKKTVSGEEEGGGGGEGTAVDEGEFEEGVHTLGQVLLHEGFVVRLSLERERLIDREDREARSLLCSVCIIKVDNRPMCRLPTHEVMEHMLG